MAILLQKQKKRYLFLEQMAYEKDKSSFNEALKQLQHLSTNIFQLLKKLATR